MEEMSVILYSAPNKDYYIVKEQEKSLSNPNITITPLLDSPVIRSTITRSTVDCREKESNGPHRDDHSIDSGFASADEDEDRVVVEKLLLERSTANQHNYHQHQQHTCIYCDDVRDRAVHTIIPPHPFHPLVWLDGICFGWCGYWSKCRGSPSEPPIYPSEIIPLASKACSLFK